MRLRSNSCCLLLFSVSSTAPLAASLTSSRVWGSSTAASSRSLSRCPVPRRDYNKEASCRAAATTTRTPTSLFAGTSTNSAGTDTDTEIRPEQTKNQRSIDEKDLEKHDDTVGHAKQSEDEAVQDNKMKFRNFEEMLEQHRETPILVSFEAKWCGPCKLMKKELKIVRDKLAESVMVARIDTEKFPSLGARYKVEGLPSVILFVDGELVHRIEGLEEAAEIIRQVRGFLR